MTALIIKACQLVRIAFPLARMAFPVARMAFPVAGMAFSQVGMVLTAVKEFRLISMFAVTAVTMLSFKIDV